jgi:hypothetical protein
MTPFATRRIKNAEGPRMAFGLSMQGSLLMLLKRL